MVAACILDETEIFPTINADTDTVIVIANVTATIVTSIPTKAQTAVVTTPRAHQRIPLHPLRPPRRRRRKRRPRRIIEIGTPVERRIHVRRPTHGESEMMRRPERYKDSTEHEWREELTNLMAEEREEMSWGRHHLMTMPRYEKTGFIYKDTEEKKDRLDRLNE
ncbi:uncharacterized protein HMPREF1541_07699 [Cyphellophora europaea CBS 101466]|uniref:Uncharacterized protein n=1 Tax=Cyphellophora europaea (strain CBS 101466) TaxID=1220924 RepID=W2RP24_CYPE1|nr:uncharacterized protein HMPREF1541_07699 [Cyphellophora europaea CBS 101466]ETN38075.1 hypothetical protein HMPREF1541_07699 [Cyphellophora europaea CBS 101466]